LAPLMSLALEIPWLLQSLQILRSSQSQYDMLVLDLRHNKRRYKKWQQ